MRRTFAASTVAIVCVVSVCAARPSAAQSDAPAICVALARSEMGSGPDLSTSLRGAVVDGLRAVHEQAVALNSGDQGAAVTEGSGKGCAYLLMTRVRSGGSGGLMQRMSNIKPKAGAIKRGDIVSLEYRLTPIRSANPIKADKLEVRAQEDGEDVLTPLVARLSSAVAVAAVASADARRGDVQTPAPGESSDKRRRGKESAAQQAALPSTMDCEQMSASSHGVISVAACKQMMGAQQAYAAAAADPAASRPGDDKMTCDQIVAEMKQQSITAPDKARTAEAQAATTDLQETLARQQKEAEAMVAKESAEMAAASVLGTVSNAAAAKAAEKVAAEQKAANERMTKEQAPKAERAFDANAALMNDMGQQAAANPRLARLVQLATQKSCKGQ